MAYMTKQERTSASINLGTRRYRTPTARESKNHPCLWYDPCNPDAWHSEEEIDEAWERLGDEAIDEILDGTMFMF